MSWLLMAVTLSLGLTACGSDDDSDDNGEQSSELVGKWENEDETWGFKLDADGKGYSFENPSSTPYRWSVTWTYKNNVLRLIDEDGDSEIFIVTYVDDEIMIVGISDGGSGSLTESVFTLYKVRKFSWE